MKGHRLLDTKETQKERHEATDKTTEEWSVKMGDRPIKGNKVMIIWSFYKF